MKKIIWAMTMMVICTVWTACEKEDYEVVPPTFKGFSYSPTTVHPGDSVRFTACYADPGKNIYLTGHKGYTWKLTVDTLDAGGDPDKTGQWTKEFKPYCSIGDGEPSYKLQIPALTKPGSTARLDFTANYSNAADGKPGVSLPNITADGYYGKFSNSTINSILYSSASGWMTFRVD